ncbi:MAG: hypothetical protein ACE1ZP_05840, partial [Myxococcota bacterium]
LVVPLVGAVAADGEVESPPGSVTLDQLLTLPLALPADSGQRAGQTRAEWNSRFAEAESAVETAKTDLDESLDKLSELVGKKGNWKIAAPGVQAAVDDDSPADYGLKQQIRRNREEVVRTERALRDLIVEANLAGVPKNWYSER